ncbi:MAG: transcription termination factor Rho [Kribbellaceae bacterium]|jgi:transcription termination factor Rho|nr:transcription termination factor Rho [Kribbellaceae bacterium]
MLLPELKQLAGTLGIKGTGALRKGQLIEAIKAAQSGGGAPASAGRSARSNQPTLDEAAAEPVVKAAAPVQEAPQREGGSRRARAEAAEQNGAAKVEAPPSTPLAAQNGSASVESASAPEQSQNGPAPEQNSERNSEHNSDRGEGRGGQNRDGDNRDRNRGREGQRNENRDGQRNESREGQRNENRNDNRGGQNDRQDRGPDRGEDGDGRRRRRRGRDRDRGGRDSGPRDSGRDSGRANRGRNERFEPEPTVNEDDILVPAAGILDVLDNYAFVRTSGYLPGPNDVYVALSMVKRYGLRKGDAITGAVKQPQDGERKEKFNPLVRIDTVNGADPDAAKHRQDFSKLTPLYATERLRLETEQNILITRIADIVTPIGKGQRGLIVSPPKAGKTMVLQALANAITTNNPEVHLMVVLVDERPEEVTDMQRTVKGEVIASTFDRPADDHTTVAELAIERAKRLVELGHDVVVLLDSITRLGRAYNIAAPASGRILSGGVDSSALYPPKRFFGAARNIEDGGSLTILATALIETGSKMDEVIFEEFKGTGNMELRLRREFADRRIFPAIDVVASSTRREELLMSKDETAVTWKLRRVLSALDGQAALELLIGKLKESKSNIEFLLQVNKTTPSAGGRNTDDGN